ncbi:MAG TPA: hypothetical protein VEC06_07525 [Paucimonas sp.]|nr:hypothetical protein [Paucimonas sp.]
MRNQFRFTLIGIVMVVGGCVTTNTRISPVVRPTERLEESLAAAKKAILVTKQEFQNKLALQQKQLFASRLAVFGGAVGAAAGAIYSAPRDVIAGMGLISATGYTGGNLYAPAVHADIFEAGLAATHCLDAYVTPAESLLKTIQEEKRQVDLALDALEKLLGGPPQPAAAKAIADGQRASRRAQAYILRESGIAAQVFLSLDDIVRLANKQVHENSPNLDAFAQSGRAVFAMANVSSAGTSAPPPAPSPGGPAPGIRTAAGKAEIDQGIRAVEDAEKELDGLLNRFDKLGDLPSSTCIDKAKFEGAAPLTLNTDDLSLKAGSQYRLNATGGRPGYWGEWVGQIPPKDVLEAIQAPLSPQFLFDAKKSFKGSTFKYRVLDSGGTSREVTVCSSD